MMSSIKLACYTIMILFISTSMTACSVFSPVKIEQTSKYILKETPAVKKDKHRHRTILVAPMMTNHPYDTTSMAYVTKPYELHYFVKSEWADLPARMLQNLIVKTLYNTHHYRGVLTLPTYARYDYILNTQLIELKQVFIDDYSYYQVQLRADIISTRTLGLVASKDFKVTVHAKENTAFGGVLAANKAAANILKQLARFVVQTT